MGIVVRMLRQSAVYWAPADVGFDDYGRPVVNGPIEIDCRWEDVAIEFIDDKGTRQISKSRVYVKQDVEVGGVIMLGVLSDLTDINNPKENDGAWEIRSFEKLPNLKNTETLRTVYL